MGMISSISYGTPLLSFGVISLRLIKWNVEGDSPVIATMIGFIAEEILLSLLSYYPLIEHHGFQNDQFSLSHQ